ncbi:AraC family transcriptional regulator [Pseudogracilibacillus sp. SO30301A]|uniref:AraC family transcriptional regulator n=1 Tax=Pseudogracilibacillus sp. SO30301A TaxID=3098291 RepID=UPI003FA683A1
MDFQGAKLKLLSSRDVKYKIKEVAEMVGFTDPLYFSRRFKEHIGISPKTYLNKFMNNP